MLKRRLSLHRSAGGPRSWRNLADPKLHIPPGCPEAALSSPETCLVPCPMLDTCAFTPVLHRPSLSALQGAEAGNCMLCTIYHFWYTAAAPQQLHKTLRGVPGRASLRSGSGMVGKREKAKGWAGMRDRISGRTREYTLKMRQGTFR